MMAVSTNNSPHRYAKSFPEWLAFALNHPDKQKINGDPAACVALSIVHVMGGAEREIHGIKLGGKRFDDAGTLALADTIRGIAQTDAQNMSGSQQYVVYAFYEEGQQAGARFVLRESGHLLAPAGDLASEPPTLEGQTTARMRREEGMFQAMMATMGNLINQQNQFMTVQGARVVETARENRELFAYVKEVVLDMVMNTQAHDLKVLEHRRNTEIMSKALQFAPSMINTITGKEVVPQGTADTMLLEALAEAIDEDTMATIGPALLGKVPAAAQGVLFARLEQIVKAKNAKEEGLKKHLATMHTPNIVRAELGDASDGDDNAPPRH